MGQRTTRWRVAAVLVALLATPQLFAAGAAHPAPDYRSTQSTLAPGVVHRVLRQPGTLVSHVAHVSPGAPVRSRLVLASDRVGRAMETTSEMCRRTPGCLVAVNGDFGLKELNQPVGGVVVDGRMLRSPDANHLQLSFSRTGDVSADYMHWTGRLRSSDGRSLRIDGINTPRGPDQIVLYTPEFDSSTKTSGDGLELVVAVDDPAAALRLGETTRLTAIKRGDRPGDNGLFEGVMVLSGHGAGAKRLEELGGRMYAREVGRDVELRIDVREALPDLSQSLGCAPALLQGGQPKWLDPNDPNVINRHPRTIFAWNGAGEQWWVTIDGRQRGYSEGLKLQDPSTGANDAAEFVRRLGASDACNLDGGGSTTFVTLGRVTNRPSDVVDGRRNVERRVTQSLMLVADRNVALASVPVPVPPAPVRPAPRPAPVVVRPAPPAPAPAVAVGAPVPPAAVPPPVVAVVPPLPSPPAAVVRAGPSVAVDRASRPHGWLVAMAVAGLSLAVMGRRRLRGRIRRGVSQ